MMNINNRKLLQLKMYGLVTFLLSTIIVVIEYNASRSYWQHWIRISACHILYQYLSDPYFLAYVNDANLRNFWSRCFYIMKTYLCCYLILVIQWYFNSMYINQLVNGDNPDLSIYFINFLK